MDAAFARALDFFKQGRLKEAERALSAILKSRPDHCDGELLLAMVLLRLRTFEACERHAARAIAINEGVAQAHAVRGVALAELGRANDALASFDRAIRLKPDYAECHYNRGQALSRLGRHDEALSSFEKAIVFKANYAEAFNARGSALIALSRPAEALLSYDRAIELKPAHAEAYVNRAQALMQLRRFDEAIANFDAALELKPDLAELHYNRGVALQELARPQEAVESYERAIALKPDFAPALGNRGNALQDLGRYEEALQSYERALQADSDFAEAFYNRGIALMNLNRPEEALHSYERALQLKPDHLEARFSHGLCLLALGRLKEGFVEQESRWLLQRLAPPPPLADVPMWRGEAIGGRSILVYAERGFGDIFHFCRYVPLLAERGADAAFLIPRRLRLVLAGLAPQVRLLTALDGPVHFDRQCAVTSLPFAFGTDIDTIPNRVPYLSAPPERIAAWRQRLGSSGFKIGICWQGGSWQGGRAIRGRAIPLKEFIPLSEIPDVRLISLQKNEGVEQLDLLPPGVVETLAGLDEGADAFADTAAVMESLDLVITCDTSIAHLAGALGRSVWVGLQQVPEWRWMFKSSESPWYPTMRLFRQKARGDWQGVFADMADALRHRLGG